MCQMFNYNLIKVECCVQTCPFVQGLKFVVAPKKPFKFLLQDKLFIYQIKFLVRLLYF